MTFRNRVCWALVLLMGCAGVRAEEAPAQTAPRILLASPACVAARLGQVDVALGTRTPNENSGMPPSTISYRRAFARLAEAGAAKGADAVVLRHHDAAYLAKGARVPKRPTYIELHAAAIRLDPSRMPCDLVPLDVDAFARDAMSKRRQDVAIEQGTNF